MTKQQKQYTTTSTNKNIPQMNMLLIDKILKHIAPFSLYISLICTILLIIFILFVLGPKVTLDFKVPEKHSYFAWFSIISSFITFVFTGYYLKNGNLGFISYIWGTILSFCSNTILFKFITKVLITQKTWVSSFTFLHFLQVTNIYTNSKKKLNLS